MAGIKRNRLVGAALASALLLSVLSGCKKEESAATLVAQAKQFQQKGDTSAAMIQLKNALAASPEDGEARYLLAKLSLEGGDALAADKEIRKAISLKYPEAQTMPVLARVLLTQGKFQAALDETEAAAKQGGAELLCVRADAMLALGKRDEAKAVYESVAQSQPNFAPALVGLGRVAFLQRDPAAATAFADKALAAAPKDADALLFKADLLRAQNKPEQALEAYSQVLVAHPAHRSAHIEKAYLEIAAGKYELAQADLVAAKKTTPNSMMVTYTQALLDFTQGKNAAALESLQKVLRVAPEHMPSILLAGAVNLNLGSMQQAEQHLRKYLEKNPENLYARKMLATTLLRGGQTPDALAVLAPALKGAEAPDVQLLALAGESYMQARDFNKATEYFEKATALEPKAAALRTSLGLSKLGKGDKSQGISDLEAATALDSKSLPSGIALIRAEIGLRNFDKALAAAAQLAKTQPANPEVAQLTGVALLGKSDAAGARAAFEKALTLQAGFFPAVAALVQLDMYEKKPEAAKQRLLALVEKDKKNLDALTALAGLAAVQGQQDEVTSWLEKASAENPDALQPAIRLAVQYLRTGKAQQALNLARKLQPAYPSNSDLVELVAQSQLATKDINGALESYSKLAGLLPKSPQVHLRLAEVHLQLKNEAAAADDLKKALALQPELIQANTMQAGMLVRQKKFDAALAIARLVQKQHEKLPAGFALEGDILSSQGKSALALPLYEKALALGKAPGFAIKLADAYRHNGKAKEADQVIARWRKENPNEPAMAMYEAETSLMAKQYPLAVEQFEAILKGNPKNAVALNNLAQAYAQLKDKRALATAEQADKLVPGHPAILDTLGWILVEQGDVQRGLPLLQKAVAGAAGNGEIRYHYAAALNKSGDKAGARKELEQLLAGGNAFPQADEARALLKQL